jgi:hypothetical protein
MVNTLDWFTRTMASLQSVDQLGLAGLSLREAQHHSSATNAVNANIVPAFRGGMHGSLSYFVRQRRLNPGATFFRQPNVTLLPDFSWCAE